MKTVMVRYQVRPEAAADNEALVREVYAQLAREMPAGFRYQTVKLADGVSFVHVATRDSADASPLLQLEAFKKFLAGIKERCVVQPETIEVEVLGQYAG